MLLISLYYLYRDTIFNHQYANITMSMWSFVLKFSNHLHNIFLFVTCNCSFIGIFFCMVTGKLWLAFYTFWFLLSNTSIFFMFHLYYFMFCYYNSMSAFLGKKSIYFFSACSYLYFKSDFDTSGSISHLFTSHVLSCAFIGLIISYLAFSN